MAYSGHRLTQIDLDKLPLPPAAKTALRPERVKSTALESQYRRSQARFPVKPYNGIKLVSPWSTYERICDLRLGADFRITVAQESVSPYEHVCVRRFSGDIRNSELQMIHQIRHPSFVAALEAFRFKEETYVVFEHMQVSLHEMQRSRKRIESLHLPAILGPVPKQPFCRPLNARLTCATR